MADIGKTMAMTGMAGFDAGAFQPNWLRPQIVTEA